MVVGKELMRGEEGGGLIFVISVREYNCFESVSKYIIG